MKVAEVSLSTAKLMGQIISAFVSVSDKVLYEIMAAKRMLNNKMVVVLEKANLLKGWKSPDSIATRMRAVVLLNKIGGVLGAIAETTAATREWAQVIEANKDGREFKAAYLTKSAIIKTVAAIGSTLLVIELIWGAAAVGLLVPVIGWIFTLIAIIAGIWLWFFGKNELSPHEFWIRHCYWGKLQYHKKKIRAGKKDKITGQQPVYINYNDMRQSLSVELAEINQILNSFTVKVYWQIEGRATQNRLLWDHGKNILESFPKESGDKPIVRNQISLVIDVIVPSYNKSSQPDIGLLVTGIMNLNSIRSDPNYHLNPYHGKKIDEKLELISSKTKKIFPNIFDCVPNEPRFINAKPAKSQGRSTTLRYRIDGYEVSDNYINKLEIDVHYYPGPTYTVVYPNPAGVRIDIVVDAGTNSTGNFFADDDGIVRRVVSSYLYQKENKYINP
ncbi:hypothetical protein MNBD_GAMMA12-3900 [hydrothermal vent metagenome]|uniref:Uncharacterized protein n=1 Tax=hydrothermal vent metagenome TaxID=652676 RepID=A0A3B0YX72_9ZZZZ